MKAVITVIGKDQVGIIANTSQLLAKHQVNILDISQTTMQDMFTMIMLADLTGASVPFSELSKQLDEIGQRMGLSITIQRDEVFRAMHRI